MFQPLNLNGEHLMDDLTEYILELIRLAATDLPPDVEASLWTALENEDPGSAARGALFTCTILRDGAPVDSGNK
jgi:tartrate dehydratase alpha subunit/fumarate hydratase class I-like protein